MKVRGIIKRLEKDGWVLRRMRGSHRQYKHSGKPGLVTVAGKPSAEPPPKTLACIFKQAGWRKK